MMTTVRATKILKKNDTGTLGKAMQVLEIVSNANSPMRFTEILELSDQPRGTLHRQISNLVEEGLLTANPDHSYELGISLLKLASKAWSNNDFRQIAAPHLLDLHAKTGETIHLGILKNEQVIYLDKVESQQSVRMYSQVGNASPLYCTGVGKAALSTLNNDQLEMVLQRIEFNAYTQSTILSVEDLNAEILDIKNTGNAWDREEHEVGIHCVAAPVFSTNRHIAAGVSVTGPVFRISKKDLKNWAPLVRETADKIMNEMAAKLSPKM